MGNRFALLVAIAVTAAKAPMALAQEQAVRGFIGGSASVNSSGVSNVRLEEDAVPLAWFVEGGGFMGPRVAIGAELYRAPTVTSHYSSSAGSLTGEYNRTSVLGTIRVRLTPPGRVAFDAVGGAGIVFENLADSSISSGATNGPTVYYTATGTSAMSAFGADLPVMVAKHFEIVPAMRVYLMAAGTTGGIAPVESATTLGARVSGRVVW